MAVSLSLSESATHSEMQEWALKAYDGRPPLLSAEGLRIIYEAHGAPVQRPRAEQESKVAAQRREVADLERQIVRLQKENSKLNKHMKFLDDFICGEECGEKPSLIRFIKTFAWELIHERGVMRDTGPYDNEKLYGRGAAVTHQGGLWVAQAETQGSRPGEGGAWRLTHKTEVAELRRMVRDEVQRQGVSK